jgi:photosystem II stability/assembly factor-like uncharacterized protein
VRVATPPRRPDLEHDRDLEQRVADLEALIEEARRRARRRRRVYAALVLGVLGAAAWAAFGIGGGRSSGRPATGGPSPALAAQASPVRWHALRGPEGGEIFALAVDPADSKVVYAGSWGSIFKSTDGGGRWRHVTSQPWTRVAVIAIDPARPNIVYAGTDRGVGKTTDGGRHWRMVNTGLFDGRAALRPRVASLDESAVWSLTIDAQHPSTVFATTALGLYRTTNGGKRWHIIGPPFFRKAFCAPCAVMRSGYVLSVAIDPNHAQTIYASWARGGVSSNLFESTDGGDRWRRITMPEPLSLSFLALTASGALLGADPSRPGVYRSTDGGRTWSLSGVPGDKIGAFTVDGASGAIYVTTYGGKLFQTTDGGDSWQTAPTDLAYGAIVTDPSDPAVSYAAAWGNPAGIVKSVDHGHTWTAADKGIHSTVITSLAFVPSGPATLYAGTLGNQLFKSTNRGRTWRSASAGLGNSSVSTLAVEARRPHTIFAGTQWSGLFKTTDGGLSWHRVPIGFPAKAQARVPAVAADPQHPDTVYVAACRGGGCVGPGVFLKSVDGGSTWRRITTVPWLVQAIAIDPRRTSTVFAGTTRGGLFRSRDGGSSWHQVATARGVPQAKSHLSYPYAVVAIAIDPLDPGTIYAGSSTGGILKSTDGGTTWAVANAGLTNRRVAALIMDPRKPRVLFASTEGGVFRSANGGESWHPYNRGLPAGGVAAFAINPAAHTVFAGTNGEGVVSLRLAD